MEERPIISVRNVSMHFNLMTERINSLKEYVINFAKGKLLYQDFIALKNVSFDVKKGEVMGIIGFNGSGKSTILNIIAGVLRPTEGSFSVRGTIAPRIALGAGFDPELTAEENIYLNGAMLGHSHDFMKGKFDEIIDFAELRDFIHVPVKNFSSGMYARLGFAIATLVKPDILIADEILAVGDFRFQEKCEAKINQMISEGVTVVLVSHSTDQIIRMCNRVVWLDHGNVKAIGETEPICDQYMHSSPS